MSSDQQDGGAGLDLFQAIGEDADQFRKQPDPEDLITPGARKKAEELKVDLEEVKGTGKGGKVIAADVQKVATERAREKTRTQNTAAKKEPEEYDKDRFVSYAGNRIEIPSRFMQLEEVREMIEGQFPELSKERTEMIYDEELGLVIPVLKGHRKGSGVESFTVLFAPPKGKLPPVCHVLGKNGVYEVRSTQTGTFVARVAATVEAKELVRLRVPEIPLHVLRSAVNYLRDEPTVERLVNIVWSYSLDAYGIQAPDQEGTASNVEAAGFTETDERFIVLQLHSHGVLPAFWSAIDDADEVRTGLYGVVGRCDQEVPEMRLRYSCGGMYRDVDPGILFEQVDFIDEIVEVLG